ncbi:MAG: GTP-binding protein YchF [Candidatus Marinamargulisbacteria bacterium]|jgi:GTP-binding protein YchF
MDLSVGIVGFPNVGKSTLFNAITASEIEAQNYPFCTIEPNVGIVSIPDSRLNKLQTITNSQKIIPAAIKFVDIAGLVPGASKGEGLGNKFLSHIRETSVIAHVVRCFEDDNIVHVHGKVDPIDDVEIINLELILADLEMATKMRDGQLKKSKTGDKEEKSRLAVLEKIVAQLEASKPVRQLEFTEGERLIIKGYHFLSSKRIVYVANIKESEIGQENEWVAKMKAYAEKDGDECIVVCARIEEEIAGLDESEKKEFLEALDLTESGLDNLSRACFSLLGLQTFLTSGEKETRAWTISVDATAPEAAGVIHTDFEKGFIRANIISFDEFVACDGLKIAKEKGLVRQEGKEYKMQDGDIVEFLFNV